MSLRVLHIGKFFPPHRGGMETFLADLLTEQTRQGLAPAALVHASGTCLRDRNDDHLVDGKAAPVIRAAVWLNLLFAPIAPLFWLSTLRALRRHRPDLLHLHMPNASVLWLLLLPAARRLPWVVHWHSDVLASPHSRGLRLLYPLYRPFEQAVLRRAATIIATSPPYLDSSAALVEHRSRCEVIPLGLDDRRLRKHSSDANDSNNENADASPATATAKATTESNPPDSSLSLLAIGRLTYYKGFQVLLEAIHSLPAVSLTIIGAGDEEAALRAQIHARDLDERVEMRCAASDRDVSEALRACDLLCQPSLERTEAFGLVLLEAMALGKPVLASDIPGSGMPWLVRESGAGALAPPGDAAALAAQITRLAGDRDKLHALGEAGRACFNARFRIDIAAAAVSEVYRRLAGK